ncbi:M24 family metallopeptidase [Virgibacillus kekensis]|uniref:M24 family metallopeptidase n=1 Tax=Virgibacillus kekensis TaxID=202261 RepID=A0ABV9DFF5_9BACI
MTNRLDTLLNELRKQNLDSMLVTSKANFYYLSNYYTEPHERVIAVYVSKFHDPLLIIPSMEKEDALEAGWKHKLITYSDHENPWELFQNYLKKNDSTPASTALEYNDLSLERYQQIKAVLPGAEFADGQEILANLRVIKSNEEYELLQEAAKLADFGVKTGIEAISEGVSEMEIIGKIEFELKKQGIREMSFTTMTLSGAKTASPHGTPTSRKISKGDMVLFDLGVIYQGYCSDITRTVAYKSVTPEQEKVYNTVLEAEKSSIHASQIGTPVGDLDKAARNYIEQAGYGKYFTHRVGHGIGVETHEYPSMHSNNKLPLKAGMCYTIEPGIYVPGTGGVRIEDMVFMTEDGPEILTKSPKELRVID